MLWVFYVALFTIHFAAALHKKGASALPAPFVTLPPQ